MNGADEQVISDLKTAIEKHGILVENMEAKYTKIGVAQYLDENETDVAIIAEYVEAAKPYTVDDYELLVDEHEDILLIPLIQDQYKSTVYVKQMFSAGIFNALFSSDASPENLVRLIKNDRSRKECKVYYGIKNADTGTEFPNIHSCIEYIERNNEPSEIIYATGFIKERIKANEFITVLRHLNPRVKEVLKESEEYQRYFLEVEDKELKEKKAISTPSIPVPVFNINLGTRSENLPREAATSVVNLKDVIRNVLVGFSGVSRRSGSTHQAINCAEFLAAKGFKVAVLENRDGAAKTFQHICKERCGEKHEDFFTLDEIDFYPDFSFDEMNRIFSSDHSYHFVILDYGLCSRKVRTDIGKCFKQYVVCGSNPWEKQSVPVFRKETESFDCRLTYLVKGVAKDDRKVQPWLGNSEHAFLELSENMFQPDAQEELWKKEFEAFGISGKQTWREKVSNFFSNRSKMNKKKSNSKIVTNISQRGIAGTYFVTQLKHGVGCTHFASTCANVLLDSDNSVVLVHKGSIITDCIFEEVEVYEGDKRYDTLYSKYAYVIYDGGVYQEMSAELKEECNRAYVRIMMCHADDDYLKKLAAFVEMQGEQANKWVYVFNGIPNHLIPRISNLMAHYETFFLPVYSTTELPKKVNKLVKNF